MTATSRGRRGRRNLKMMGKKIPRSSQKQKVSNNWRH